jgi:3-hydroxybutyryl-CoA dehydrogenase
MSNDSAVRVAVLGLGTMGHGIVQAFASQGIAVQGYDEAPAMRASLQARVRNNLLQFARFGLFAEEQLEATLARISVADTLPAVCQGATFVVEAVREDLPAKQALFAEIETYVAEDTILASNSSSFPISQSGGRLKRPERALVTHWFNPPHIVPTVEIVPSPQTSEAVTQATLALHKRIGKLAIVIRQELPGFLVNRVQVAVLREVWDLVERGVVSVDDLDTAVRGSMGFRLAAFGPLMIHDFGGLDIQAAVYRNLCPEIRSDTELPKIMQDHVGAGHFGFKSGEGFYEYPAGEANERLKERDERYLALLKLFHAPKSDNI